MSHTSMQQLRVAIRPIVLTIIAITSIVSTNVQNASQIDHLCVCIRSRRKVDYSIYKKKKNIKIRKSKQKLSPTDN